MVELYEGEFGSDETDMQVREDPDLAFAPDREPQDSLQAQQRKGDRDSISAEWQWRRRSRVAARSIF